MTKQERAIRTRSRLVNSAADVFRRQGYERASLASISSQVGVSSGALHFHFENKAALASAVVLEASRALCRSASHIQRTQSPALQALIDTTHALAELLRENVVVQAGYQLSVAGHGTGQPLRTKWQSHVARLIVEADREGMLRAGVPREDITASIVASTVGFELLGRDSRAWLSRGSLTGYWQVQLTTLASYDALDRLLPAGTDSARIPPQGTLALAAAKS